MAKIELYAAWAGSGTTQTDGNGDYEQWSAELFTFDTVLRTVATSTVYQNVYATPVQDTPPPDLSYDTTVELARYVSGATLNQYYHNGTGGINIVPTTLMLRSLVTGSTCFGGSNGAIAVQVSGLPGPYVYLWDDGPTTRDRGPLPAGTYRLAVTDGPTGAIARLVVVVGANPALAVVVQKTGANVALQVSGGVGPYTYLWDDGSTARDRTGLPSGARTCQVTDALGCTTTVDVLVSPDVFYWSRNPITLPLDAGAAYRLDPTTKPNLSFLCEVWVERDYLSGAFEQVGGVLEQPADRTGRTEFEVQALLDVFLQHHLPAPAATALERADPMFRRFYLKYAESYGDVPVRAGTTVLTQNYVVLGGLNFYESRRPTFADVYQRDVMPFLTWEPLLKPALPDQPEFLYYLVRQSPAGFRVWARVHYTDATTELVEVGSAAPVRLFEVYCQPVGYRALGLADLAGAKRVRGWDVFVTAPDGTTALSETRRFVLDERVYPRRRYFLFATSLGGMATYAATGDALLDAELSGEEARRTPAPLSDPLLGDTAVQTRQLRPVVKAASGPRTRAQQEAAQDFLLSRRVLLLSRDGTRWLPGFVKPKTLTLVDEGKPVPTLEFEFYLPTEQLYTPALGAGTGPVTYAQPAL